MVLESVTVAFEADYIGVVNDTVDHRGGDREVAEHVTPAGEGQIARHDERGMFVAGGHELEEQVRGVLVERDIADLVDDQQTVTAQPDELGSEFAP